MQPVPTAPTAAEDGGLSTHVLHMTRLHAKRPLLVELRVINGPFEGGCRLQSGAGAWLACNTSLDSTVVCRRALGCEGGGVAGQRRALTIRGLNIVLRCNLRKRQDTMNARHGPPKWSRSRAGHLDLARQIGSKGSRSPSPGPTRHRRQSGLGVRCSRIRGRVRVEGYGEGCG